MDDGHLGELNEAAKRVYRVRAAHAATRKNQRALGREQGIADHESEAIGNDSGPKLANDGLWRSFHFGALHIHRNVDEHRAGPPRYRDHKGLVEHRRNFALVFHAKNALRYRLGHRDNVGLLEAKLAHHTVALLLVAVHLPGDKDGRRGIEVGAGYARKQVGRARAAGRHRDGGHLGKPAAAFGRKGRALLMPHADDGRRATQVDRVEHVGDHAAHQLEHSRHLLHSKRLSDIVGSLHGSTAFTTWNSNFAM